MSLHCLSLSLSLPAGGKPGGGGSLRGHGPDGCYSGQSLQPHGSHLPACPGHSAQWPPLPVWFDEHAEVLPALLLQMVPDSMVCCSPPQQLSRPAETACVTRQQV